jgi:hypothetical protein
VRRLHLHAACSRMACRVRERLRNREVGGRLHRSSEPSFGDRHQPRRDARTGHERVERRSQAAFGERCGWMPRASSRSSPVAAARSSRAASSSSRACAGSSSRRARAIRRSSASSTSRCCRRRARPPPARGAGRSAAVLRPRAHRRDRRSSRRCRFAVRGACDRRPVPARPPSSGRCCACAWAPCERTRAPRPCPSVCGPRCSRSWRRTPAPHRPHVPPCSRGVRHVPSLISTFRNDPPLRDPFRAVLAQLQPSEFPHRRRAPADLRWS